MDRVRSAVFIPIVVFPIAAIIAIAIGMFLHLVRNIAEETGSPIAEFATPITALILVVIITVGAFVISGTSPSSD